MITKERLEELIKKGATIYNKHGEKHKLCEDDFVAIECGKDFLKTFDDIGFIYDVDYLENLFETKKQAEWASKYHRTRTEELNLPVWEEIKSRYYGKTFSYNFCRRDDYYITEYMLKVYTPLSIDIFKYDIDKNKNESICDCIFTEDFTEENYIKACDLCLKWFEGEENGNN